MALRDLLFESGDVATATAATSATRETGRTETVAKVAAVAVAKARDSKTDGVYEAIMALENATTAGKVIAEAKVGGVSASTIENSRDEACVSLCVSEHLATATPATPPSNGDKAVERARDSKTGELVPRRLAMVEPMPGNELQARLGSFRSRTIPKEIHLVDILCPAHSGGMKGLTLRVDQLPELIRALQSVQTQALEHGLLSKATIGEPQSELDSCAIGG